MGVDLPKPAAMKKDELVQAVAEAAAGRRWLPACLRWPHAAADNTADPERGEADDPPVEPAPDAQAA
jgi:DNA-binding NarL/FixJ family response regulator